MCGSNAAVRCDVHHVWSIARKSMSDLHLRANPGIPSFISILEIGAVGIGLVRLLRWDGVPEQAARRIAPAERRKGARMRSNGR